jgi:GT2 family glycosyltransferase
MFERPKSAVKVSVITVNYNETASTCALLDSIQRQAFRELEVIVVDNASREDPGDVLQARYPAVKYLRSEQNLGFAGGNNLALPHASGEFLFFVNNDAELEPGCIETLLLFFENQPRAGIVSPLICYFSTDKLEPKIIQYAGMTPISPFTGRNQVLGEREVDSGQFATPSITAYAHGAAMMLPRKVLETVGPMWEGFFLYYEELDWGARIQRAGLEAWVEPRAKVWHKESLTIQKMGTDKLFYLTRNRILFMRRNFSGWYLGVFWVFFALFSVPKQVFLCLIRGEFNQLKTFLRGIIASVTVNKA